MTALDGRRRPSRLGLGLVALAAAAAFWWLGPPPLPVSEEEPTPAPTTSGGVAGLELRTTPPVRATWVAPDAHADRVLTVRVYGDEQCGPGRADAWPQQAAAILQDRLAVAPAPWTGVRVQLEVVAKAGWTAAHALEHALTAPGPVPELVLVALGWNDGSSPGEPVPSPSVEPDEARAWWLAELAAQDVLMDVQGGAGFFLRSPRSPSRLEPLAHLQLLDALGQWGQATGAAVVYLEQPARSVQAERTFFATTAMRPQPWISLVYGLEQQPEPGALLREGQDLLFSERGERLVARFVGVGLVHHVVGRPR